MNRTNWLTHVCNHGGKHDLHRRAILNA